MNIAEMTLAEVLALAERPVSEWPPVLRDCYDRALRSVPAPELTSAEPVRRFWLVGFVQGYMARDGQQEVRGAPESVDR